MPKKSHNLRLKSLDYSKNKNSFYRFEIFKNFNICFNRDQFNVNLRQIDRLAKKDQRYRPFLKFYNHYWNIYKTSIDNFANFYNDSSALLSRIIPFNNNEEHLSLKKVRKLVAEHFISSIRPWVIISDDHRISHATIAELATRNNGQTAVIVIDNHADIYGPAFSKNNLLKFNPFKNLIESEIVEHVFFLCPSFKEILSNKSIWKDIAKNISLIPLNTFMKRDSKINLKKFETVFAKIVKQKSIKNIFFSIDIDALSDDQNGIIYSAFEYSILNSILYLSLLSDKEIKKYKNLSMCLISTEKMSRKKLKLPTMVRIRNPYKPGLNTVNEIGITSLMYCEIIKKIAKISKKMGLTIGLGSCTGEVVELMGPDWNGETTKATIQIINVLNSLQ